MESDVSVACGGDEWNKMLWIAIISIFVYGLGIPVAFWALLYINRLSLFRELTLVKVRRRWVVGYLPPMGCGVSGVVAHRGWRLCGGGALWEC